MPLPTQEGCPPDLAPASFRSATGRNPVRPPGFVLSTSRPEAMPQSYIRYLVNSLRDTFGIDGVPIRMSLRAPDNPFAGRGRKR